MSQRYQAGDTYAFGNYMQGDSETVKTPIEWEILDIGTDEITLLSKYVLDISKKFWDDPYDEYPAEKKPKMESDPDFDVRKWLNGEFAEAAFTDEERRLLRGEIGLLSYEDIERYYRDRDKVYSIVQHEKFSTDAIEGYYGVRLIGRATPYAVKKGVSVRNEGVNYRIWDHREYMDGYRDNYEDWSFQRKYKDSEITHEPTCAWLLEDDFFVSFNADVYWGMPYEDYHGTYREIYYDGFCEPCVIAGIRPLIRIAPPDRQNFAFRESTHAFLRRLPDVIEELKCKGNTRVVTRPPASDAELEAFLDKELDGQKLLRELPADYLDLLKIHNGIYIYVPKGKKDRDYNKRDDRPRSAAAFFGTVQMKDCPYIKSSDLYGENCYVRKYLHHDHLLRLGGHLYNDGRFGYYALIDFYYYDTDSKDYVYIKDCVRDDSFFDEYEPPRRFPSLAEMLKHALHFFEA